MSRSSPEYLSWYAMKRRCLNPKEKNFKYYGGRGITICGRWMIFANFLEDMRARPAGTSLDRIDNNSNYEPGNCRWATQVQQIQNSRATTHGHAGVKTITKTYYIWRMMKDRCYRANNRSYKYYGGRGVYVCDQWRNDFARFLADMGEKPDGLWLHRINTDGPYSPDNCRWSIPMKARPDGR